MKEQVLHKGVDLQLCVEEFQGDYEMYCSYCGQWDNDKYVVKPVSEETFIALTEAHYND